MFTQEWRDHWALRGDPFACEDADKDFVLAEIDSTAVHSGFDRIYGDPRMPAPGIVFGEKGSGKSGLRLMMARRLAEHNANRDEGRIFVVEYIDFNSYLERFRARGSQEPADVLAEWSVSDHLDCLLSLATTKLVDLALDEKASHQKLTRKQRVEMLLLAALYHDSKRRTTGETLARLRRSLRLFDGRTIGRTLLLLALTLAGVALALLPHLLDANLGDRRVWYGAGALLIAGTWIWNALGKLGSHRRAKRAAQSIRVLRRDPAPLAKLLRSLPGREHAEFPLPEGHREEPRYGHLDRMFDLTEAFGYGGWYVLMDRVDEPSLFSGDAASMASFIESLLDIKLLQHPGLALKLFLPIELETIYRSASPDELKSMRLDKSNLIPELKWSGQELYEIANKRLRACLESRSPVESLADLVEEDFDLDHLRATLGILGTPRYCFGFLSAVVLDHLKELPSDLGPDDPAWRIPRARFDVERAAWIDRSGILRRTMN